MFVQPIHDILNKTMCFKFLISIIEMSKFVGLFLKISSYSNQ